VKKLLELIENLSDALSNTHKSKWSYLVHAVIDVYKQKKKDELEDEELEEDI